LQGSNPGQVVHTPYFQRNWLSVAYLGTAAEPPLRSPMPVSQHKSVLMVNNSYENQTQN